MSDASKLIADVDLAHAQAIIDDITIELFKTVSPDYPKEVINIVVNYINNRNSDTDKQSEVQVENLGNLLLEIELSFKELGIFEVRTNFTNKVFRDSVFFEKYGLNKEQVRAAYNQASLAFKEIYPSEHHSFINAITILLFNKI
jgi:hypothetical protein